MKLSEIDDCSICPLPGEGLCPGGMVCYGGEPIEPPCTSWYGDYTFAFDNIKDKEIIEKKLQMIREHTDKQCRFYVFCGFNHNDPGIYSDEFWKNDIAE